MFNYILKETNGMDASISDIISKLKFIGRVQKGEKLNVRYMFVQPDSWITRFSRTFFATDNRANSCQFIDNIIKRSFEIINLNKASTKISERCLVVNIITDLKEALKGIKNLKETYGSDVMFCCKLDTISQETNSRLVELESNLELIQDYNNKEESYNEDVNNVD